MGQLGDTTRQRDATDRDSPIVSVVGSQEDCLGLWCGAKGNEVAGGVSRVGKEKATSEVEAANKGDRREISV